VPHLDGASSAGTAPVAGQSRRNPREDAEKEPLVKRALDVLGAQIVRVDDGFGEKRAIPEQAEAAVTEDT
jgi:hypothetical protein